MSESKPKPVKKESDLVVSVAKWMVGGGVIAGVILLSPIDPWELLNFFLFILLPIMLVLWALNMMGTETLKVIWNEELSERIAARYEQLKREMTTKKEEPVHA